MTVAQRRIPMRNSTNADTASAAIVPKTRNAVCVFKLVKFRCCNDRDIFVRNGVQRLTPFRLAAVAGHAGDALAGNAKPAGPEADGLASP